MGWGSSSFVRAHHACKSGRIWLFDRVRRYFADEWGRKYLQCGREVLLQQLDLPGLAVMLEQGGSMAGDVDVGVPHRERGGVKMGF